MVGSFSVCVEDLTENFPSGLDEIRELLLDLVGISGEGGGAFRLLWGNI